MDILVQEINLKSTEIVGGWGSAPDPAGGAYDAPPDPLIGFARALRCPRLACASRVCTN